MTLNDQDLDKLFREYLPKIIRLAEKKLAGRTGPIDPNDVAATVCRTVFRRMSEGKFQFDDDESLWRQLCVITHNRLNNKYREEFAQKRDIRKTENLGDGLSYALISREPNPEDATAFIEVLDQTLGDMDDLGRRIIELRLEGYGYSEIADELGVSDRTVGRKILLYKQQLDITAT